jgi:HEAT repeat protein
LIFLARLVSVTHLSSEFVINMHADRRLFITSMIAVALITTSWFSLAFGIDPQKVALLCVSDPQLNADWGMNGQAPPLSYTVDRFKATDRESVMLALETCQQARRRGEDIPEEWVEACRERLRSGEKDPKLRGALSLFVLGANMEADGELLWSLAENDPSLTFAVEERLIEWKSPIALETWRKRLQQASLSKETILVSVRGIAALGVEADVALLEQVLRNRKHTLGARYAAAAGIARIDSQRSLELMEEVASGAIAGEKEISGEKASDGAIWDYWIAVSLLVGKQDTERTKQLLLDAIRQGSDTARSVALHSLAEMSTEEFKKQLEVVRHDPEINVRLEVLRFLTTHADEEAIVMLGDFLGDAQPRVRELARNELLKLADNASFRPVIEREVSKALRGDKWWQIEQALIAAASLEMKGEEGQCFALLEHPRGEVYVTAAWSLRILANTPEVLAKMVEAVRVQTDRVFGGDTLDEPEYHRIGHLIEGLSIRQVAEARPVIERYVPKDQKAGLVSRMCGLWGLSQYLKGKPESKFSEAYITIVYDKFGFGAEFGTIRYCAMIGLGNFQDPETKAKIEALEEGEVSPIAFAKKWALAQIEKAGKGPTDSQE